MQKKALHVMWLNESEQRIFLSFTFQYSVLFKAAKFNYNKSTTKEPKGIKLRFMLHTAVFTASLGTDWDGTHIGSVVI